MIIGIILFAILVPTSVSIMYSIMQQSKIKISKKMSDNNFTVMLPNAVAALGIILLLMSLVVIIGFTFFSNELPHLIFYVSFASGIWLGTYLFVKTLTFKVIVKDKNITVFSAFRKPYSFTFDQIVSAQRKTKNNQVKSEWIVIKTLSGKRLIVESSEISYERFLKKVMFEVKCDYLIGFEKASNQ